MKTDNLHVPSFFTMHEAVFYAQEHTPYQKAMSEFQNRDFYSKYGDRAKNLAMQIHQDILAGKQEAARKGMKALSIALPQWVFDYERRGR